MAKKITLSTQNVAEMAKLINLPLKAERIGTITRNTEIWYNNANALAEKMMDEKYLDTIPASILRANG